MRVPTKERNARNAPRINKKKSRIANITHQLASCNNVLAGAPWTFLERVQLRFDTLARSISHSKQHISVALRVQEESPALEAIKKIPYLTMAPDPTIFEDLSEEYRSLAGDSETLIVSTSSIDTLVGLIQQAKFAEADRVLSELLEMGWDVPVNPIFEKAVIKCPSS
jgi:hypothetical protein